MLFAIFDPLILFCSVEVKKKMWQPGWCCLGIQMWSQSCTVVVCSWSAWINTFKCMSSQGSFCLQDPRTPHVCWCSVTQCSYVSWSVVVPAQFVSLSTWDAKWQFFQVPPQLLCSYLAIIGPWLRTQIVVREVYQLLPKSTSGIRNGAVPQLLQSLIRKDLLSSIWLCQMSWYISPVIAQKWRSPCLSSQERLWTLHYNVQKSLLVLGSVNSDADVNDRRTEEVEVGKHALCFCMWEAGHFDLNACNSEALQISTCIWKTLPHLFFFRMPASDGYENHRFQLGCPRNFLV